MIKVILTAAAAALAVSLSACGGSPSTPPTITPTPAASSAAPGAQACRTATAAVTGARALIAGVSLSGADSVPALKAAGRLLARAGRTVAGSGVPLFRTLAGSVDVDLALAAAGADGMVLATDLGRGALFRQNARQLRSGLAKLTRECAR